MENAQTFFQEQGCQPLSEILNIPDRTDQHSPRSNQIHPGYEMGPGQGAKNHKQRIETTFECHPDIGLLVTKRKWTYIGKIVRS